VVAWESTDIFGATKQGKKNKAPYGRKSGEGKMS
jgi:hypothetical protein